MLIDITGNELLAAGENEKAIRHFTSLATQTTKNPAASMGLALSLAASGRLSEALIAIENAIYLAPDDIDTRAIQSNILEQMGNEIQAIEGYLAILQKQPHHLTVGHNLGCLLYRLGFFSEAIEQHRETLQHHPKSFVTWRDLGQALIANKQHSQGLAALKTAYTLAPTDKETRFAYSLGLLRAEMWEEAWQHYGARWHKEEKEDRLKNIPEWNGEKLNRNYLKIISEQGYGDTILFSRYIQSLVDIFPQALISLTVPDPLSSLMKASFPKISINESENTKNPDYAIHLGDLPLQLISYGIIKPPNNHPYLKPSSDAKKNINAIFSALCLKKFSGIVWKGNPSNPCDRKRSIPIDQFLKNHTQPDQPLLSLQKNKTPEEEKLFDIKLDVIDASPALKNFDQTAALMMLIGQTITVDTATANLAGALNMPFTLIERKESEWRWGTKPNESPWYKSCHKKTSTEEHIL